MSLEPLLAAAAKRPGVEVTDDTLPNGLPWPPTYDSIRFGASVPDTWICVDCGWNTAPRMGTAQQMLEAFNARHGVEQTVGGRDEVYCVTESVWAAAGMGGHDGCLCFGVQN